ncbi:ATP-binding protein [Halobaculum sp. MBLA0147]|uniref:ATP-binding protein n=1 Tax=Halobaculum sp. MBLA0147 TaxID=3079934 RepID=UPI00352589EE
MSPDADGSQDEARRGLTDRQYQEDTEATTVSANHERFQQRVDDVLSASTTDEVARTTVQLIVESFDLKRAALYERVGERLCLVTENTDTKTPFPEHLSIQHDTLRQLLHDGTVVSGTPPSAIPIDSEWCAAPTGEGGLIVGVEPKSDRELIINHNRLSRFATVVGTALHLVDDGVSRDQFTTTASDLSSEDILPAVIREVYPDYAFLYDADGTYQDVLLGQRDVSAITREELIGSTLTDVFPAQTASRIHDAIRTAVETDTRQTVEYPVDAVEGRRVFEGVVTPIVVDGTDQAVLIARDVTERSQRESKLRRVQRRSEWVLESTTAATWSIEFDGDGISFLQGATECLFPEAAPDVSSVIEYFDIIVHPDDRERVVDAYEAVRDRRQEEVHITYRTHPEHGDVRWLAVDGFVRETDTHHELVGHSADVTIEKQQEHQLETLHQFTHAITVADSVEGICRRTVEASRAAFGFSASLVSLVSEDRLVPQATTEDLSSEEFSEIPVNEGIAGRTYRTGESMIVNDTTVEERVYDDPPYRSLLSVPIGDHGNLQAAAERPGAFDATDRELAETLAQYTENALDLLESRKDLKYQNNRLEKFASVVSHDLRNPLNVASGRIELAQRECGSDHLAAAEEAINRSQQLIDDLLTLTNSESDHSESTVFLETIAKQVWTTIDGPEAILDIQTGVNVTATESRLRQLIANLFGNAVKHGGPAVTVTVETVRSDDKPVGFAVTDDGSGLQTDEYDHVFDHGYTTADSGTGLGLAIVSDVASEHGWEVSMMESAAGGVRVEVTGVETRYDETK